MCYFNKQHSHRDEIKLQQHEQKLSDMGINPNHHSPVQNGFAYGDILCLVPKADKSNFEIVWMEWGFLPKYITNRDQAQKMRFGYKDPEKGFKPPITTLNAKGEELLLTGKIYRDAALQRRCLVLSSGFYEWRHIYGTNKRTGQPLKTADKFPYHIGVKGEDYFYMAGIYQEFTDRDTGELKNTVAIITTNANKVMQQIHNSKNRMPTILPDELAYRWIFDDLSEEEITQLATYQFDSNAMEACTISKDFQSSLSPAEPFIYETVPALEF